MSIFADLGLFGATCVIMGALVIVAVVSITMFELSRMLVYGWLKLIVTVANWLKIKGETIDDLRALNTKIAERHIQKSKDFVEWEFKQMSKKS